MAKDEERPIVETTTTTRSPTPKLMVASNMACRAYPAPDSFGDVPLSNGDVLTQSFPPWSINVSSLCVTNDIIDKSEQSAGKFRIGERSSLTNFSHSQTLAIWLHPSCELPPTREDHICCYGTSFQSLPLSFSLEMSEATVYLASAFALVACALLPPSEMELLFPGSSALW